MGRRTPDLRYAQVTGVAEGWAGGYRKDLDRNGALAAIRAITTDIEVYAEAAARYASADLDREPNAYKALGLFTELGAKYNDIARHLEARQKWRSKGDLLGHLADQNNRRER